MDKNKGKEMFDYILFLLAKQENWEIKEVINENQTKKGLTPTTK